MHHVYIHFKRADSLFLNSQEKSTTVGKIFCLKTPTLIQLILEVKNYLENSQWLWILSYFTQFLLLRFPQTSFQVSAVYCNDEDWFNEICFFILIDESRQPLGLDLSQDVNPFQQQGNAFQFEHEISLNTNTDEERENCRKFRLTVFYKMALVWAKKKKLPSSEGGPSLHYLNSCSMYWPRRDLMRLWLKIFDLYCNLNQHDHLVFY